MTMFQNLRRMMGGAATLKISCEACGHKATWTCAQAFQRLGGDATPLDCRRQWPAAPVAGGGRRMFGYEP